ncbi:hypothetical protein [Ahrensia sp. 13_GOM-1096m]|uniref:hypothetical protein n=1 Tax=Ahrensia sp. 13_GOM-1096m TaxID=1380380 RepID=UPI0006887DD8|nr:hypothetical protein [Ahrensia sp. 13_GOM-1096m]
MLNDTPHQDFVQRAKWAFTTRRVERSDCIGLSSDIESATPGDLILGEVINIRSHKRIQLSIGRYSTLYEGDLVVLACGARYAPDQYEGIAQLNEESSDMLAGGGVIGLMRKSNTKMAGPTNVKPLGIICNANGHPINIEDYALASVVRPLNLTTIAAVGSSMNGGKTTAVASFAHGLTKAGHKVAAIKVTGTGSFGDYNTYQDTGALFVADFVDAGMVSTYQLPIDHISAGMNTLLGHASAAGCDVALIEFADGIFQAETAAMLKSKEVREIINGYIFAAPCAASVVGGCQALRAMGIEPSIVTGKVSASPLAIEEAQKMAAVTVVTRNQLLEPTSAETLLETIRGSNWTKVMRA